MDPEGEYKRRRSFAATSAGSIMPAGKKDPDRDIHVPTTNRVTTNDDDLPKSKTRIEYDGPSAPPLEDSGSLIDAASSSNISTCREPQQAECHHPVQSAGFVPAGDEPLIYSIAAIPIGLNSAEADLPEARVVPSITHAMHLESNGYPGTQLRNDSGVCDEFGWTNACTDHTPNLLRHPPLFRDLVNRATRSSTTSSDSERWRSFGITGDDGDGDGDSDSDEISSRTSSHSDRWRSFGIDDSGDGEEATGRDHKTTKPAKYHDDMERRGNKKKEAEEGSLSKGDEPDTKKECGDSNGSYHRYNSLYSM